MDESLKYLIPEDFSTEEVKNFPNLVLISDENFKKIIICSAGTFMVAMGVMMTAKKGGLSRVVLFPSLVGSGSALVFASIEKLFKGDDMVMSEVGRKAATSGVASAIAGPIGYGGSELAGGASDFVRLCLSVLTSSTAGAASGVIADSSRALKHEEVTFGTVTQAAKNGAIIGTACGSVGDLADEVSTQFGGFFSDCMTKLTFHHAAIVATAAGIRNYRTSKFDLEQATLVISERAKDEKYESKKIDKNLQNKKFAQEATK